VFCDLEALVKTVTKKELVHRIADRTEITKVVVKRVIQEFLNAIIQDLSEGHRLEFREFGVFESRERAARLAQNPKTLEKVPVPSRRTVKFKVGRTMRRRVSGEGAGDLPVEDDEEDDAAPPARQRRQSGGAAQGLA